MSVYAPLTPRAVVENLAALTERLEGVVRALREADMQAVVARHRADLAESLAFVQAEGSMEYRRHIARVAVGEQESDAVVAESIVRSLRHQIRAIELEVEVGRSYGVAVRAELSALPYDPHS